VKSFLKIMIMLGACWSSICANAQSTGVSKDFSEYISIRISFRNLQSKPTKTPNFRDLAFKINMEPESVGHPSVLIRSGLPQPWEIKSIASDFILSQWGIICVGEYRLQQKTGLPLRFRLGSLEYVNALEGK
jgi:hypothetical protein